MECIQVCLYSPTQSFSYKNNEFCFYEGATCFYLLELSSGLQNYPPLTYLCTPDDDLIRLKHVTLLQKQNLLLLK